MRQHKQRWKIRARRATDEMAFEQALLGHEASEHQPFDPRRDRKTLQLCRQVERALSLAIADCQDEAVRDLSIESVVPMGGASQMLVRITLPTNAAFDAAGVMARLERHAANLRYAVAQSICRKRVPALSFLVVPAMKGGADELQ